MPISLLLSLKPEPANSWCSDLDSADFGFKSAVRDFPGTPASSRVQQRSWPYGLSKGPCNPAGNGGVSQTSADTELTPLADIRC